jgi:hypothetical protein
MENKIGRDLQMRLPSVTLQVDRYFSHTPRDAVTYTLELNHIAVDQNVAPRLAGYIAHLHHHFDGLKC